MRRATYPYLLLPFLYINLTFIAAFSLSICVNTIAEYSIKKIQNGFFLILTSQLTFNCSKSTAEALENDVK